MAVKRYVTSKRPKGLTETEVMVFLGLMILDSKSRDTIFGTTFEHTAVEARTELEKYLDVAVVGIAGNSTAVTGESQVKHWDEIERNPNNANDTYGAKMRISTLLQWAEKHKDTFNELRKTLNDAIAADSNYSQCDERAEEILDLIEYARIITLRRL
jgi:hypothetical protein